MFRVGIVAVLCLILAACQEAEGAASEWESWERHAIDAATTTEVDFRSQSTNRIATFGAQISVPDGFTLTTPGTFRSATHIQIEADNMVERQTLTSISLYLARSGASGSPIDEMVQVAVGEREYSGYRVMWRTDGNARITVLYLAGSQWWELRGLSNADTFSDYDLDLIYNVLESIDHG